MEELKRIIHQYKLDLVKIFKNFDKDKSGSLDYSEFTKFI